MLIVIREGLLRKNCCSLGFCPNYLPHPLPNNSFFFRRPSLIDLSLILFVSLLVIMRIFLKALKMTVSLMPRSASHQVTDMCGFGEGDAPPHDQLVRTLFGDWRRPRQQEGKARILFSLHMNTNHANQHLYCSKQDAAFVEQEEVVY